MTWVLTILFISLYGYNGIGVALLCISGTIIIVVPVVQRIVKFRFWTSIDTAIIGSVFQVTVYLLGSFLFPPSLLFLVIESIIGFMLYVGIVWIREKKQLIHLVVAFRK